MQRGGRVKANFVINDGKRKRHFTVFVPKNSTIQEATLLLPIEIQVKEHGQFGSWITGFGGLAEDREGNGWQFYIRGGLPYVNGGNGPRFPGAANTLIDRPVDVEWKYERATADLPGGCSGGAILPWEKFRVSECLPYCDNVKARKECADVIAPTAFISASRAAMASRIRDTPNFSKGGLKMPLPAVNEGLPQSNSPLLGVRPNTIWSTKPHRGISQCSAPQHSTTSPKIQHVYKPTRPSVTDRGKSAVILTAAPGEAKRSLLEILAKAVVLATAIAQKVFHLISSLIFEVKRRAKAPPVVDVILRRITPLANESRVFLRMVRSEICRKISLAAAIIHGICVPFANAIGEICEGCTRKIFLTRSSLSDLRYWAACLILIGFVFAILRTAHTF